MPPKKQEVHFISYIDHVKKHNIFGREEYTNNTPSTSAEAVRVESQLDASDSCIALSESYERTSADVTLDTMSIASSKYVEDDEGYAGGSSKFTEVKSKCIKSGIKKKTDFLINVASDIRNYDCDEVSEDCLTFDTIYV